MVSKTKQAIDVVREIDSAVVKFNEDSDQIEVFITGDVPLEIDRLVADGWLISPTSARNEYVKLFK